MILLAIDHGMSKLKVLEMNKRWSGKPFIVRVNNNGCWESISHKTDKDGYVWYMRNQKAHRYFYEKYKGKIQDGLFVCHKCDNPKCCNPEHLFLGTTQENTTDMMKKGRHKNGCEKQLGASRKLTQKQVDEIKTSSKSCYELEKLYPVGRTMILSVKNGKITKGLKKEVV